MFYSIQQAENLCAEDPSLIFSLIKENDIEVVEKIIDKEEYNFNIIDSDGNNVIMALLKNKNYDLVLKYLNKVNINHQNNDGNTLLHMLVCINYVNVKDIIELVLNNKELILNIKNNLGETILDKAIENHYLWTTMKILENDKFDSIDIYSFKNLYETYVKSNEYGKYSKLSNLEIILENIENKRLLPRMKKLVYLIENNKDKIKKDINLSKTNSLDNIINHVVMDIVN